MGRSTEVFRGYNQVGMVKGIRVGVSQMGRGLDDDDDDAWENYIMGRVCVCVCVWREKMC